MVQPLPAVVLEGASGYGLAIGQAAILTYSVASKEKQKRHELIAVHAAKCPII